MWLVWLVYSRPGWVSQDELVITLPGRDRTGRGLFSALVNTGPNLDNGHDLSRPGPGPGWAVIGLFLVVTGLSLSMILPYLTWLGFGLSLTLVLAGLAMAL